MTRGLSMTLAIVTVALSSYAPVIAAPVSDPSPAGAARIWVYREYEPYETLARPYVRFNGQIIGISEPGGSFYRDVQPGTYNVTVDSFGKDIHQFASVSLGAGKTTFIKVESARDWESGLNYRRDTFYTRVISPEMAQRELSRSQFFGGG